MDLEGLVVGDPGVGGILIFKCGDPFPLPLLGCNTLKVEKDKKYQQATVTTFHLNLICSLYFFSIFYVMPAWSPGCGDKALCRRQDLIAKQIALELGF